MPFLLYSTASTAQESKYEMLKRVKVSGHLHQCVKDTFIDSDDDEIGWHVSETDLLQGMGVSPDLHALLIDLKPGVKGNVSLYRLRDVWGFSYRTWTPVALRLEALWVDREEPDPSQFKRAFSDDGALKEQVFEFLYLRGGTREGTWGWGPAGFVNGTLLWTPAWRFFSSKINEAIQSVD